MLFFMVTKYFSQTTSAQPEKPLKTGLILKKDGAHEGFTLFAPITSTSTFLIDMEGRLVHQWDSMYEPGQAVYLLENGHLLRTAFMGPDTNQTFYGGGSGGRVQEFTWDGKLVWDFEYNSDTHLLHHDIERLPNGNILMIAWEKKTKEEAVAAGRNPDTVGEKGLWPDHIIEVQPRGKTTGRIVWEWHVWDHLIQSQDPSKKNYGEVSEHPELININPGDWTKRLTQKQREKLASLGYLRTFSKKDPRENHPDWNHINSIDYNPELDQIILSVLGFNEIWIIDHSTTAKQAAGHKGGRYGRGGDLLYRWGNPQVYKKGKAAEQKLFAQHDAQWIPTGLQGGGHILAFNNGRGRPDGDYSSIDEVVPPLDRKGHYVRQKGRAYGPALPVWTYTAPQKENFYSSHISGCERLPNGNTFICSGEKGVLFEVTPDKKVVWKLVNPVFGESRPPAGVPRPESDKKGHDMRKPPRLMPQIGGPGMGQVKPGPQNSIFKAHRYGPDYPGFTGKNLTSGKPLVELIKKRARQ
jgi:hypothetical protein